jgi:hypothetical protein
MRAKPEGFFVHVCARMKKKSATVNDKMRIGALQRCVAFDPQHFRSLNRLEKSPSATFKIPNAKVTTALRLI